MQLYKLARLFELKYDLKSEAIAIEEVINNIKREIINCYNLYVGERAKEPVLQMLSDAGEPFSKALVIAMEKMVANIDELGGTPHLLFRHINKILGAIQAVKADPENKLRESIQSAIRGSKESERNYREHVKSKLEMILSRVSSILEKQANILQKFLPKEVPLSGGAVSPQRKELSKEKLLMFMRTPVAKSLGLDMDVMARLLEDQELKQRLTTLINAVDRGHSPLDSQEVATEAKAIKDMFDKKQTNFSALEQEKYSPEETLFEEAGE